MKMLDKDRSVNRTVQLCGGLRTIEPVFETASRAQYRALKLMRRKYGIQDQTGQVPAQICRECLFVYDGGYALPVNFLLESVERQG
jgi:hypothetical protein